MRVVRAQGELIGELTNRTELEREARELLFDPSFELHRELERPCGGVLLALGGSQHDREALGVLSFLRVTGELHILAVAVPRAGQRRGVGRKLTEFAMDLARGEGANAMLLEVRRDNAGARAFYASLGFFCFNVRRRYYTDSVDALELVLALEPGAAARFLPAIEV